MSLKILRNKTNEEIGRYYDKSLYKRVMQKTSFKLYDSLSKLIQNLDVPHYRKIEKILI